MRSYLLLVPGEPNAKVARAYAPLGVGLLAFCIYAWALTPGPYWLDSGELGAAGAGLGVPHPTGFPLFCVLARIAAYLPVGELAFRIHLVSALTGALAVAWTVSLTLALADSDELTASIAAAMAGALLAAGATFFRQATVTEVYAPTAALLAGSLLLALRVIRTGDRGIGLALALIAGVGAVGVHASYRLLLGIPLVIIYLWRLARGARWVHAAPVLVGLGAFGMLCYLPLRSASGHIPLLDWDHTDNIRAVLRHLSAARIQAAFAEQMFASVPEVVLANARAFFAQVDAGLGTVALVCAAGGLLMTKNPRGMAAVLAFVVVGDFVYGTWINPMGIVDRQNGVPMAVGLAVLAGVGVAAAARRFGRIAPYAASVLAFVVLLPAVLDALPDKLNRSDAPRRFSELALSECPSRAVVFVQSDSAAAGLLWLGTIERARPDVAVLVRQHLWDTKRVGAALDMVGISPPPGELASALFAKRPVFWEPGIDAVPAGLALEPGVPLGQLGTVRKGAIDESLARLKAIFADHADESGRRVHALALSALGRGALNVGDNERARLLFLAALDVEPRLVSAYVNLGVIASMKAYYRLAVNLAETALALEPIHAPALVNAARYRMALGDDAGSLRHVTLATKVAPDRAEAWAVLGVLEARSGAYDLARKHFERALALDAHDPDASANLALLPKP